MIERRKPRRKLRLKCRLMGHQWRSAMNPKVYQCDRCGGRWETDERT